MIWFLKWRAAQLAKAVDRLMAKLDVKTNKLANVRKRLTELLRENAGRDLPHD